ncbi:hypothetical protein [Streptomyces sp. NPDC093225]|uniref:hypothetical protein n=1 Tax=Streptomyces sp. NPDC093225 TaxID=3366034 RepID=UPI00381B585A
MWVTLVATLCGTAAGVTSTIVVDKVRWRRERDQKRLDRDAELAAEFILTTMVGYEALMVLATHRSRAAERNPARVKQIVDESGAASARQKVKLLAPAPTAEACEEVWRALRELRGAVAAGNAADTEPFQACDRVFRDRLHALRVEVRRGQGLPDAEAISVPRVPVYDLLP